MAKIIKVIRCENRQTHARITVLLDDGTEATIYCGGEVEVFFHNGQVRAFVKKSAQPIDKP